MNMELQQILSICGVSGIVSGLVGVLIAVFLKRPLERRVQENEAASQRVEEQNNATMLGVQALLRDRLIQDFNFYLARGWIEAGERDNIDNMYTQYEALGPNNVISDIYNQVRMLPSIPPESHPVSAHAVAQ
jgi:hypothetical protein